MSLVQMPVDASHLKQRITEVSDAKAELKRLTFEPYAELSLDEKYAVRYHVIVLAEALGSMCLHIAREDLKQEPLSYSECFRLLDEEGICDCAKDLTAIVRLRNLLTHRYWAIDDEQVYNSVKNNFKSVDKFVERVKEKYAVDL
ncbi:MAG TPA: DUF86 domain-containing protein [Candidatus Bathyarchaeia archaeon]|nr:DUF86 domain-containing protein [Candidatus Bathyarchaeia archaeon]